MVLRRVREERRNELAQLIQNQWTGHVPLSVRYAAADAADALVVAWFDGEAAFLATLVDAAKSNEMSDLCP